MRTLDRRLFALSALLCLAAGLAAAHELGTIRTYATFFKDGHYEVEVFVDREHLPPGFASTASPPRTLIRGLGAWDSGDRVGRILAEVVNHSRIAFDGAPENPRVEWLDGDRNTAKLVLRFSGAIPASAKTFT